MCSGNAGELAKGLDQVRLTAWEKVLKFEPEEKPAADEESSRDEEESKTEEKAPQEDPRPTLEDPLFAWFELHRVGGQRGRERQR